MVSSAYWRQITRPKRLICPWTTPLKRVMIWGAALSHFSSHIKCLPLKTLKTLVPIVLVVKTTLNLMVKFVTVTVGIGLLWGLSKHSGTWGGGSLVVHYMGLCFDPSDWSSWCLGNHGNINAFFSNFFSDPAIVWIFLMGWWRNRACAQAIG